MNIDLNKLTVSELEEFLRLKKKTIGRAFEIEETLRRDTYPKINTPIVLRPDNFNRKSKRWTKEEDKKLKEAMSSRKVGAPITGICRALSISLQRTPESIWTRAFNLRLLTR